MKTVSFFNLKGGCGKTTSILNLGSLLAREPENKKVLLIDSDMQSNLTSSLVDYDLERASIYDLLIEDRPIKDVIVSVGENIDLIPSNLTMAMADPKIYEKTQPQEILKKKLDEIKDQYDYCLIDCSPSFSMTTINAIIASDEIFIPLSTEYYAIDGVQLLEDMLDYINELYGQENKIDLIFAAIHDRRNNINRMQIQNLEESYPDQFSKRYIRKNVALVESPVFQECIFDYKPRSSGAKDYKALFEDIKNRGLF